MSATAILGKLTYLFDGLDTIEQIAKQTLADDTKDAFDAVHIIAVVIDTLRAGLADKLTIAAVETEIKNLRKVILDNDAVADQALHDKFDKTDKG